MFKDTSGQEDRMRRERIAKQVGLDKVAQDIQHKEGSGGEKRTDAQIV